MSVLWRKAWRDLTLKSNRPRTLLAVGSMAVGVFALGLAFGAQAVMHAYLDAEDVANHPAHLIFQGGLVGRETFDLDLVEAARQRPGVAEAEGETQVPIRWKPAGAKAWRKGTLLAREDYAAQQISRMELLAGRWPAGHGLAIERKSALFYGIQPGSEISIDGGQDVHTLVVDGMMRRPFVVPPEYDAPATFFATPETVRWLTGVDGFNQLRFRLNAPGTAAAEAATQQVRDWMESLGLTLGGISVTGSTDEFGAEGVRNILDGIWLILIVMGGLALGASAFLIINTMNAVLAQQVWQIGMMKVLGGTFGQVVRLYLALAAVYGGLAFLLAVLPAAVGAHWLTGWMLEIMANINVSGKWLISPLAVAVQAGVGILVPLLAALPPVMLGVRITPYRALHTYGVENQFGRGRLDKLLSRAQGWPRPLALSVRNAFRRKGRMALTLVTLTLVGMLFMMVTSAQASLDYSLDGLLQSFQYDVEVVFSRPHRAAQLLEVTQSVNSVTGAELWEWYGARLKLPDGVVRQVGIYGVPPASTVFRPRLVEGRGLLAADDQAIVFNKNLADEAGVRVGDRITLTLAGKETRWTIVGLILNATVGQGDNFVPFETLTRLTGNVNRGSVIMLTATHHDAAAQLQLAQALDNAYTANHLETSLYRTANQFRAQCQLLFSTLAYLLLTMVLLAALVGGVGLAGTLFLNVVEQRREVGVMRATGATSADIAGIFVGEGLVVGILSWLCAVPLSFPAARAFSDALGVAIVGTTLDFSYSYAGALIWLGIVMGLAVLAGLWPARQAAQISVREALAYV